VLLDFWEIRFMSTHFSKSFFAAVASLLSASFLSAPAIAGPAGVFDTFSGNLNAYQNTRILNNASHSPTNTYNWQITNGRLELNTTSYVGIEQFALTRTDVTLAVGEEYQADFTAGYTGTQDIGLYVGAGHPTVDVRQDYVAVYVRNNGQVFTRGFNGTTEFGLAGGATPAGITSLFVRRTATDVFELGYFEGATRSILATRTITSGALLGSAIGAYADVRAAGIVGGLDNLRIIPPNVLGDVNGDTFVNIADFNIIKTNLFNTGQTRVQGDLTEDAIVDFADFRQWKSAAGPGFASISLFGVPEPASAGMLAMGALALLTAVRRRGDLR
jgi:hypothetical protein